MHMHSPSAPPRSPQTLYTRSCLNPTVRPALHLCPRTVHPLRIARSQALLPCHLRTTTRTRTPLPLPLAAAIIGLSFLSGPPLFPSPLLHIRQHHRACRRPPAACTHAHPNRPSVIEAHCRPYMLRMDNKAKQKTSPTIYNCMCSPFTPSPST